jgi:hypothetical protein
MIVSTRLLISGNIFPAADDTTSSSSVPIQLLGSLLYVPESVGLFWEDGSEFFFL